MFFVGGVLAVVFVLWQVRDEPLDDRVLSRLGSDGLVLSSLHLLGVWGVGVFIAYALLPFSRWYVGARRVGERVVAAEGDLQANTAAGQRIADSGADPLPHASARQVRTVRFAGGSFHLDILAFDSSLMSQVRQVPQCTYDARNRTYAMPATSEAARALGALSTEVEVFWTSEAMAHATVFGPIGPTDKSSVVRGGTG